MKITSHGTPVNYLRCENVGEHKSKQYNLCEIEKVKSEYKTPHVPQLNGVTKRRSTVIEAVVLSMLPNGKLNDADQKMLWSEAVRTYKGIQNSISTTGSTDIPFEHFYEEKTNIIDLFSEFGLI